MHSYKRGDCEREAARFNYNSDLSGDIQIITPNGDVVAIPADDFVDFAAFLVRRAKIAAIESATTAEILGLPR